MKLFCRYLKSANKNNKVTWLGLSERTVIAVVALSHIHTYLKRSGQWPIQAHLRMFTTHFTLKQHLLIILPVGKFKLLSYQYLQYLCSLEFSFHGSTTSAIMFPLWHVIDHWLVDPGGTLQKCIIIFCVIQQHQDSYLLWDLKPGDSKK